MRKTIVGLLLVLCACHQKDHLNTEIFEKGVVGKKIENPRINEASGLAASRNHPTYIWTHNDSGDTSRIYLTNPDGEDIATFYLANKSNRDWEDIASGPGPETGVNYLYVGEIGDNFGKNDFKYIFRLPEPQVGDSTVVKQVETIAFRYPDRNRDAECLLVDPLTKDFYVISKREPNVIVYKGAYPQPTTEPFTVEKLGRIPYDHVVGGDISPDGMEILLKTYQKVLYWKRQKGESVFDALQRPAQVIPYLEQPQGEAIAWSADGSGFYTVSEEAPNIEASIHSYARK
ncbi:hypothetical protein [Fulvivirga ligni]|uniref:hypothetical protein n=1 Tax=Fulvivirga ligni TaxID=2904246 RepID=UPI001F26847D|nr:hypothetical protein [Fulvivirga ligni]UII22167.1 hypothetical protein LVD16_02840 [Fulvivirga ligni]